MSASVAGSASSSSSSAMPAWEDMLLFALSVDTRKRFERAVHNAKINRRKKGTQNIGDEYIFYQGNKLALPQPEFVDFFQQVLILRYVQLRKVQQAKKDEQFARGGAARVVLMNDDGADDDGVSETFKLMAASSAAAAANSSSSPFAPAAKPATNATSSLMSESSNVGSHGTGNASSKLGFGAGDIDMDVLRKDKSLRSVLHSIEQFLNIFFAAADAERSGRVDWDRVVQLVEDVIAAGGIVRLVGGAQIAAAMARGGDGTVLLGDQQQLQQGSASSAASFEASMSSSFRRKSNLFGGGNDGSSSPTAAASGSGGGGAFIEESKAAAEHESTVGLACASMRVLRVMRYVGERNRTTMLPSANAQLEQLRTRLVEAEEHAALTSQNADPVQSVTAAFAGPPPTRGDFGGSILPPPPMFRTAAGVLRQPICNMSQARLLLDTPFEPSRTVPCAVQPIAAAHITRLQYQPSCGMFTALCKETNEVRFLGESQAFLQRLALKNSSKVESVTLWPTVAASKALAQGAGSIFEACAYSCFLGLLDGTVQLWSLRDTRIGPGMRNISLRLETQIPSGYVMCSMHVPFARPSSVLCGTSTGDLLHWDFDPHIVDDFMGGSDVSWVQAAAFRKLLVSRKTKLHEGRLTDMCTLGDIGVRDMSMFADNGSSSSSSSVGGAMASASDGGGDEENDNSNSKKENESCNKKGTSSSSSAGGSKKHTPVNIVTVGWDSYAIVTDIAVGGAVSSSSSSSSSGAAAAARAATGTRRFLHPAGLLTCCAASESVLAAAGFVTEPHLWDIRSGSGSGASTHPIMKLYDKRSPHVASVTSLSVLSHLLPGHLATAGGINTNTAAGRQKAQMVMNSIAASAGAGAGGAPLPPLLSCDSVGKINVWDLRVGRTLADFDIHALVDDACDALSDARAERTAKKLRRMGVDEGELAGCSMKEHRYSDDSCRATISRRTGRIFVATESRSSIAEFGSVTPVGQDPRGVFPSDAVIAVAFVASQHLVITAHADVIVLWELSRRKGVSVTTTTTTTKQQATTESSDEPEQQQTQQQQTREEFNVGLSPFCVSEVHEFVASDIDAAAAAAARDKVLYRDKNSNKPPISTTLQPGERLTTFTLHSRGHQYGVGTNRGRVFVARVNGGEVVFLTEATIFPDPRTEIKCLASASAPHLYCDRLTSFSTLVCGSQKTLFQDDSLVAIGSDERVFCIHSLRMQIVQIYPKGTPLLCQVSRHDVMSVMCNDSPHFFVCDPLQVASLPAFPKPQHKHPDVTHHMTSMTVAPWLDCAFLGDAVGRVHCLATRPHPLADIGKASHMFSAGFEKDAGADSSSSSSDDDDQDDFGDHHGSRGKKASSPRRRRGKKKESMFSEGFTAFAVPSAAVPVVEHEEEESTDTTPSISCIAAHHVGSATFQEFTLVVAGTDVGRLGWWKAVGEMAELRQEDLRAAERRRSSIASGTPDALLSPSSAAGLATTSWGATSSNGGGGGGRRKSSVGSLGSNDGVQHSSAAVGGGGDFVAQQSVTFSCGNRTFYARPRLHWVTTCKFHEGRIDAIAILPAARRESIEFSSELDALWIAAAATDGRVSLVKAATGEFVALVSAGPAGRLGDAISTAAAQQQLQAMKRHQEREMQEEKQRRQVEGLKETSSRMSQLQATASGSTSSNNKLSATVNNKPDEIDPTEQRKKSPPSAAPTSAPTTSTINKRMSTSRNSLSRTAATSTASGVLSSASMMSNSSGSKSAILRGDVSLPAIFFMRRFIRNMQSAVQRRRKWMERSMMQKQTTDFERALSQMGNTITSAGGIDPEQTTNINFGSNFGGAGLCSNNTFRRSTSGSNLGRVNSGVAGSSSATTTSSGLGGVGGGGSHLNAFAQSSEENILKSPMLPRASTGIPSEQFQHRRSSENVFKRMNSGVVRFGAVLEEQQQQLLHNKNVDVDSAIRYVDESDAIHRRDFVDDDDDDNDDDDDQIQLMRQLREHKVSFRKQQRELEEEKRRQQQQQEEAAAAADDVELPARSNTTGSDELEATLAAASPTSVLNAIAENNNNQMSRQETRRPSLSAAAAASTALSPTSSRSLSRTVQIVVDDDDDSADHHHSPVHQQQQQRRTSGGGASTATNSSSHSSPSSNRPSALSSRSLRSSVRFTPAPPSQQQQAGINSSSNYNSRSLLGATLGSGGATIGSGGIGGSGAAHWGQTMMLSTMTVGSEPVRPKRTKITFEEMKAMHRPCRTFRAAGPLEEGLASSQQEQQQPRTSPQRRTPPSTGPLLAGPIALGGIEPGILSPHTVESDEDNDLYDDRSSNWSAQLTSSKTRARARSESPEHHHGGSSSSSPIPLGRSRTSRPTSAVVHDPQLGFEKDNKARADPLIFRSDGTSKKFSSRPQSARSFDLRLARDDVEKSLRDVTASRFLLPESRDRVRKRFAQSVVVSSGTRSIVPLQPSIPDEILSAAAAGSRPGSARRPSSAVTSSSSRDGQAPRRIIEKILKDPDSDMSSKILPPSGGGEVSARKASDVLQHTSARTNELVLRKAAVESEAARFRFRFDVESRKKRDALLARVDRMSGCIDEALTPASITSIGAPMSRTEGAATGSATQKQQRSGSASAGALKRHWTPSAELLQWMEAPVSSAKEN